MVGWQKSRKDAKYQGEGALFRLLASGWKTPSKKTAPGRGRAEAVISSDAIRRSAPSRGNRRAQMRHSKQRICFLFARGRKSVIQDGF